MTTTRSNPPRSGVPPIGVSHPTGQGFVDAVEERGTSEVTVTKGPYRFTQDNEIVCVYILKDPVSLAGSAAQAVGTRPPDKKGESRWGAGIDEATQGTQSSAVAAAPPAPPSPSAPTGEARFAAGAGTVSTGPRKREVIVADVLPERERVSLTTNSKDVVRGDILVKMRKRWTVGICGGALVLMGGRTSGAKCLLMRARRSSCWTSRQ